MSKLDQNLRVISMISERLGEISQMKQSIKEFNNERYFYQKEREIPCQLINSENILKDDLKNMMNLIIDDVNNYLYKKILLIYIYE